MLWRAPRKQRPMPTTTLISPRSEGQDEGVKHRGASMTHCQKFCIKRVRICGTVPGKRPRALRALIKQKGKDKT